jgi:hypothetical protein
MPCRQTSYHLILILLLLSVEVRGQECTLPTELGTVLDVHAGFIYTDGNNFRSDLIIELSSEAEVVVKLNAFFMLPEDSIEVYRWLSTGRKLKTGVNSLSLLSGSDFSEEFILPSFRQAVSASGSMPAGSYKLLVSIERDTPVFRKYVLKEVDSTLAKNSTISRGIDEILAPPAHPFSGLVARVPEQARTLADNTRNVLNKSAQKIDMYLRKKGLTSRRYTEPDEEIIEIWSGDWLIGKYALWSVHPLQSQLSARGSGSGLAAGVGLPSLGNFTSVSERFRQLSKAKSDKELSGELALSANFSNDQEQFSQVDNNYYEARGTLEFPIMDIPVSISGYYTTQDRNREAKASYVHFRYDSEKAKEQLLKLISGFNKNYAQSLSQGLSFDAVYGQMLSQLQSEKDKAVAELKQHAGLNAYQPSALNTDQLKELALSEARERGRGLADSLSNTTAADSLNAKVGKGRALQQKALATAAEVQQKYEQVKALEEKINKYRTLLDQYKHTLHYDSLLAYSKVKDLNEIDEMSYRDMAKKASALMPEGKAKNMLNGLTSFDAGMFPKQVSNYTLAGQMLKGADMGYDLGFAEVGLTYGRTEYIDRTGQVESYKAYGARVQLKPVAKQSIGLVYYGYSPARKLLKEGNFFKGDGISLPSFRNPVQIVSLTHKGAIGKHLELEGEYAISDKPAQSQEARDAISLSDKSAWNLQAHAAIPKTSFRFTAGYEQAGRAFENNTLPVLLAGTQRLQAKGKGDFFNSFLSLGIEYNYLLQHNLHSTGNNSRWGFDLATHSRRFPSVSLSYKPFSTFRAYNDTMDIEQKPLLGAVWTGRVSYQIKWPQDAIRINLMYNRNRSILDTIAYSSSLLQLNAIYSRGTTMFSVSMGSNKLNTGQAETAFPAFNNSIFLNTSAAGKLSAQLTLSGGLDLARSGIGWSRYGFFVGPVYTFKRLPFMLRSNFRYSNYRLDELQGWTQLYSGGIELAWRFRYKMKK